MPRLPTLLMALAVAATTTACARSVELNTDAGQSYAVNVTNPMPHAMVVSYDDGTTERLLGTVEANRSDRFIIAGSNSATISIIARDEAETHTVRKTVVLVAGGTVEVRLSN